MIKMRSIGFLFVLAAFNAFAATEPAPLSLSEDLPPLPGPALAGRIAALKQRRNEAAAFVLQNTKAVVKAAAGRRSPPVRPVFQPGAGRPDETAAFRSAVRRPADLEPNP